MFDIVIVGAGGFGREIHDLLPEFLTDRAYRFKGYLGKDQGVGEDADVAKLTIDDPESYVPASSDRFVLAIGNMDARKRTVESLVSKGAQFISLIHPRSLVSRSAQLGTGVIVYPFAVVSNETQIGDYAKLNYYASAGHNVIVGRYSLLAPYATVNGFSVLEECVYMSTHSTVAPMVTVGDRSKVSANSAVMRNVPPNSLVHGVPGRVTRRMEFG